MSRAIAGSVNTLDDNAVLTHRSMMLRLTTLTMPFWTGAIALLSPATAIATATIPPQTAATTVGPSDRAVAQVEAIPETKKQLIYQLLEMTGGRSRYEQMQAILYGQLQQQVPAILEQTVRNTGDLSPEEADTIIAESSQNTNQLIQDFTDAIQAEITYDDMLEAVYYPVYDEFFTEAHLKGLIAFYETPLGQKLTEISPDLFQTSLELTNEIYLPRMIDIMTRLIEEQLNQVKSDQIHPY